MRLMPVTSYFKSPHQSNKCPASVTSVGFKVLPLHELLVFRGHRCHCHSELLLPQYFWPAVYKPSALSSQLSLYMDTWLLLSKNWNQCTKSLLWALAGYPSSWSSSWVTWHMLLTQWFIYNISSISKTCYFEVQREIMAVDINEEWRCFIGLRGVFLTVYRGNDSALNP